jgi:hypothetical protein
VVWGLRFLPLIAIHLLVSLAAAAAFAWQFGHDSRAVLAHVVLIAEWDLAIAAVIVAAAGLTRGQQPRWPSAGFRVLLVLTGTLQSYLYALNAISNVSWGRNITGHLVVAFAPSIWSGKEPFPVGRAGILVFACATLVKIAATVWGADRTLAHIHARRAGWIGRLDRFCAPQRVSRVQMARSAVAAAAFTILFGATLSHGAASRDSLFWRDELLASFFRPVGFAFEPTPRRDAVAERDAVLQASYPLHVPGARLKHVVLIIVDSLRADRMQAYGYERHTTPFLSDLVRSGRMKKVDAAFSTCSESFCGITSTLASRQFPDISARTFELQDLLRRAGYQTWFLLSGNHSAWNGLPQFYRASDETFFDGSETERYTMDDDRVVLEGLERVPPASPDRPAFFYLHLMSTHYLGVQFPESHLFTSPDDSVDPGFEPYRILEQLNKPDRYDDKVRQADGVIAQIFAALAAKRYLDDALVVVTADHGEGLGERHWAHGWDLHNEDIRIPLLLYDTPASAVYPDLSFATQVDIAPTIVDRLGLPVPASWQGQSLLAPTRTRFTYHQTYFVPNRFAVLYRQDRDLFKFISTPQYGKEELYDLTRDDGEVTNLVKERPALAALLRAKLDAYRE